MRIAILSDGRFPVQRWYPGYGLGRSLARLGTALAKRGHAVTLYGKTGSEVEGCHTIVGEGDEAALVTALLDQPDRYDAIVDSTHQFPLMQREPTWPIVAKVCDLEGRAPFNRVYGCLTHVRWHADAPSSLVIPEGLSVDEYPFYPGPRQAHLLFVSRGMMAWKRPDQANDLAQQLGWPIHFHGDGPLAFPGTVEPPVAYPAFFAVLAHARAVVGPTPTMSILEGAAVGTPGLSLCPDDNLLEDGVTGFAAWTVEALAEKAADLDALQPAALRDWVAAYRRIDQTAALWESVLERAAQGERW